MAIIHFECYFKFMSRLLTCLFITFLSYFLIRLCLDVSELKFGLSSLNCTKNVFNILYFDNINRSEADLNKSNRFSLSIDLIFLFVLSIYIKSSFFLNSELLDE